MIPHRLLAVTVLASFLSACSGDDGNEDHVFKEQTKTIDRAREVENVLQDAADRQRKAAEDATN